MNRKTTNINITYLVQKHLANIDIYRFFSSRDVNYQNNNKNGIEYKRIFFGK